MSGGHVTATHHNHGAFLLWLCLFCLALPVLAAPVRAGQDDAPETLRLAVGEWPPYISEEAPGGGPFLDRAVRVFEAAGYDVTIAWMPWNRALEMTRQGVYDATLPWYFTEERNKTFKYADTPVGFSEFVVFYRRDRFPKGLDLNSFDAIAESGLVVAGLAGYFYEKPLNSRDVPFRVLHQPKKAWTVMEKGLADIFLEARKVGYNDIRTFFGPDTVDDYAVGGSVRKDGMYVMVSRAVPNHDALLADWEDHAAELLDHAGS